MTFLVDGQTRLYNLTVARVMATPTTPIALSAYDGMGTYGHHISLRRIRTHTHTHTHTLTHTHSHSHSTLTLIHMPYAEEMNLI